MPHHIAALALLLSAMTAPGQWGDDIRDLQTQLRSLHYEPGRVDGFYDTGTVAAVWAFQRAQGLKRNTAVPASTWRRLKHPRKIRPLVRHGSPRRVEIDLRDQRLVVYRRGKPVLITHVSTGSGKRYCSAGRCERAVTPTGDFRVFRRDKGWHRSPLGWMYRPLYFYGGIALHGSTSVPLKPASHGCVRVAMPLADRIARLVRTGDQVFVR